MRRSPDDPLTLEILFAAAGAIGLLAAQVDQPDIDATIEQALDFGERMAAKARRRRVKK